MLKKTGFILACLLAGATPAFAQGAICTEPTQPAMIDGNAVTRPQLVAAIAQVKDFIAKSDDYQQCIVDGLNATKAAAEKNSTPFDPALQQVAMAKIAANQQIKDKLVADINTQAGVFKKKNP